MIQWFAENAQVIAATLAIITTLVSMIMGILVRAGWLKKKTAQAVIETLEDSEGVARRAADEITKKKGLQQTDAMVLTAITKALKREARERAVKTGVKSVVTSLMDSAAEADPKKSKPTVAMRLGNILGLR